MGRLRHLLWLHGFDGLQHDRQFRHGRKQRLSAIFLYGGLNSITNSGVISGNGGIIISNATTDGADEIVNSGAIYGNHTYGVLTGNGSTKLTNTGQITGGVSFSVSYDTLINKATITGNVKFGAGGVNANPTTGDLENYYDGTGGSVFRGRSLAAPAMTTS